MKKLLAAFLTLALWSGTLLSANAGGAAGARSATVGGDVFLGGRYIEVGISKGGSFGTKAGAPVGFHSYSSGIGLSVDEDGFDTGEDPVTGDFFLPGTPEERFILAYAMEGTPFNNSSAERQGDFWDDPIEELHTEDQSDVAAGLLKAVTTGITKENIRCTQIISFHEDDRFFLTTITIENLSAVPLQETRYLRSFDPDQDADLQDEFKTYNKVIANPRPPYEGSQMAMVVARGSVTLTPFFYLTNDSRARASAIGEFDIYDAYLEGLWVDRNPDLPTAPDPANYALDQGMLDEGNTNGYKLEDRAISLTFNLGDLAPSGSVTFSYYSSLDSDIASALDEMEVDFVPVENIENVPAVTPVSVDLPLAGTVVPEDATHQAIVWSVKEAGTTGASLEGAVLKTTAVGSLVVTATIANGLGEGEDYAQDFTIVVVKPNPYTGEDTLSPIGWMGTVALCAALCLLMARRKKPI